MTPILSRYQGEPLTRGERGARCGRVERGAPSEAGNSGRDDHMRSTITLILEVFERSKSKISPLEKTLSKLANPVELSWGLAGVSTGVASFDWDLRIGIFETGFTLTRPYSFKV